MDNIEALYAKWLNGDISDEELKAAEGGDTLADLDRVINTVDKWTMPKYDTNAGYHKFKKKHQPTVTKHRTINWYKISAIAASLVFIVFSWSTFIANPNQTLSAANGQNKNFAFNDGSEVWLNDGSTIEYNQKKWSDKRTINLTGEAKFEVSKGSPFTVNTQNGSVSVLGTQFNVKAWGDNLYVECYEGKVRVTANNQETILVANEAVNVTKGTMLDKQNISTSAPGWQNAISRFYDENLTDVFKELERQYDIKVNISNTERSFSGKFQHDDLEAALRSICKPLGLKYTIEEDQKSVKIE